MVKNPSCKYSLGGGLSFSAFSLSPDINSDKLTEMVSSLDGKVSDINSIQIVKTDYLDSIQDLKLDVQEGKYIVPKILQPFREAIQKSWDSEGKFNGPVLIATGKIKSPLKVVQGEYYDYASTKLNAVPATLLPNIYAPGKTVETILSEGGLSPESRAKYFGFAHLMQPSNKKEFLLVYRAKGMGIAGDCISSPGSTPDLIINSPGLDKPGFGIDEYWSYHFAEEMRDEFHIQWGEFWTEDIHLFEDKKLIPFGVVNIVTELSTKQISEKAYSDPRVLKEHNILYSIPQEAMHTFLNRFPVFPNVAKAINIILEENNIST